MVTEPASASCPECGGRVSLAMGTLRGEVVSCGECLAELEVVGLAPIDLALAPEVEEDWGE
ncbi:MAG: lysine biosynthesis protein LysW [Candidatus Dormiibacterota bacterium]